MTAPAAAAGVRINIGCGNKRLPGFLGVDKFPCAGADTLCDAMRTLPFKDDSVDEVMMDNFIEHVLDVPALMQEVLRVCRDGAQVTVITPHFTALASWRDPTHVHHFSYFSMDHFQKDNVAHYIGKGFRITHKKLSFGGGLLGLLARLIFAISPEGYEQKWCFMFRASTLTFRLAVGK
jgi:SAM-dependent methyltransferase